MSMRQYTEIEFPDDILEWIPMQMGLLRLKASSSINEVKYGLDCSCSN